MPVPAPPPSFAAADAPRMAGGGPLRRSAPRRAAMAAFFWAALALVCLAAAGSGRAAGDPAVSGLAVLQAGTFAAVSGQESGSKNGRYRLVQTGEAVAARAGTAFGVEFEVRGGPPGAPVTVEAALVRPGGEQAPVQRWLIATAVGEKAQAVGSFVYAWEAEPGPWRLALSVDGRVLAEQPFYVGERPAASPEHAAAPPEPVAAPPATVTGEPVAGPQSPPAKGSDDVPATPTPPPAMAAPEQASPAAPTAPPAAAPAEKSAQPAASDTPNPSDGPAVLQSVPDKAPGKSPEKTPEKTPEKSPEKAPDKPADKPGAKNAHKPADKARAEAESKAKGPMYLLQTGVFSVRGSAYDQAARYRAKGYPACVLEEGGGKTGRYRVIVGRFPDQERAAEARRAFLSREAGEVLVKEFPAADVSRRLKCR